MRRVAIHVKVCCVSTVSADVVARNVYWLPEIREAGTEERTTCFYTVLVSLPSKDEIPPVTTATW